MDERALAMANDLGADLAADERRRATEYLLRRLGDLGGPRDGVMPAFHDMSSDIVVAENSGKCITVGDVRLARELTGGVSANDGYVVNREIADLRAAVEDLAGMLRFLAGRFQKCPRCRRKYVHKKDCALGKMLEEYKWAPFPVAK